MDKNSRPQVSELIHKYNNNNSNQNQNNSNTMNGGSIIHSNSNGSLSHNANGNGHISPVKSPRSSSSPVLHSILKSPSNSSITSNHHNNDNATVNNPTSNGTSSNQSENNNVSNSTSTNGITATSNGVTNTASTNTANSNDGIHPPSSTRHISFSEEVQIMPIDHPPNHSNSSNNSNDNSNGDHSHKSHPSLSGIDNSVHSQRAHHIFHDSPHHSMQISDPHNQSLVPSLTLNQADSTVRNNNNTIVNATISPDSATSSSMSAFESSPDGKYNRYDQILSQDLNKQRRVYLGIDTETGKEIAWTQLPYNDKVYNECLLIAQLQHPNVLNIYEVWRSNNYLHYVTEKASYTLRTHIHNLYPAKKKILRKYARQILEGLSYLHSKGIIHRDLTCENIYIDGATGDCRIGNFGLFGAGTPGFIAPDIYSDDYTSLVDIWSFAMVLFTMATDLEPYYTETKGKVSEILKLGYSGAKPQGMELIRDEAMKKLIEICLVKPEIRPSAEQLLNSELLKDPVHNSATDHTNTNTPATNSNNTVQTTDTSNTNTTNTQSTGVVVNNDDTKTSPIQLQPSGDLHPINSDNTNIGDSNQTTSTHESSTNLSLNNRVVSAPVSSDINKPNNTISNVKNNNNTIFNATTPLMETINPPDENHSSTNTSTTENVSTSDNNPTDNNDNDEFDQGELAAKQQLKQQQRSLKAEKAKKQEEKRAKAVLMKKRADKLIHKIEVKKTNSPGVVDIHLFIRLDSKNDSSELSRERNNNAIDDTNNNNSNNGQKIMSLTSRAIKFKAEDIKKITIPSFDFSRDNYLTIAEDLIECVPELRDASRNIDNLGREIATRMEEEINDEYEQSIEVTKSVSNSEMMRLMMTLGIGLNYAHAMIEQEIAIEDLLLLNEVDLKEFVPKLGPRRRLQNWIDQEKIKRGITTSNNNINSSLNNGNTTQLEPPKVGSSTSQSAQNSTSPSKSPKKLFSVDNTTSTNHETNSNNLKVVADRDGATNNNSSDSAVSIEPKPIHSAPTTPNFDTLSPSSPNDAQSPSISVISHQPAVHSSNINTHNSTTNTSSNNTSNSHSRVESMSNEHEPDDIIVHNGTMKHHTNSNTNTADEADNEPSKLGDNELEHSEQRESKHIQSEGEHTDHTLDINSNDENEVDTNQSTAGETEESEANQTELENNITGRSTTKTGPIHNNSLNSINNNSASGNTREKPTIEDDDGSVESESVDINSTGESKTDDNLVGNNNEKKFRLEVVDEEDLTRLNNEHNNVEDENKSENSDYGYQQEIEEEEEEEQVLERKNTPKIIINNTSNNEKNSNS